MTSPMCGFLTIVGKRWQQHLPEALDRLATRGPDDRGLWQRDDVGLGHRRLAVIDLSAAGHQPMLSDDGRYVLAFNGEIYNYLQLREEIEAAGVRFRGSSDTEVLLRGCELWGLARLLPRLDGMFAFTLWDTHTRTLQAARDRLGVKPLFYSSVEGLIASSTLEPFWALPGFPRRLDHEALRDYLASGYIPAPHSILADVRALPPASWLVYDDQQKSLQLERYWEVPSAHPPSFTFDELVDAADSAIRESVRRQMVADVPVGAFLSGGIDSSLLVHYMAQVSPEPVRTFSVSFPQRQSYDESGAARVVAHSLGCEHQQIDAQEIGPQQLADAAAALDQPLGDAAYLPTLALSQQTRQQVTVAISGDGGDEVFGGYPRFLDTEDQYPCTLHRALLGQLAQRNWLPGALTRHSLWGQQRLLWDRVKAGPFPGSRKDMAALLAPDARGPARIQDTMHAWLHEARRWSGAMDSDALMRADLWTYLSDNCLVKTDRASMRFSLEVRVPLLGNPVLDLMLPQPAVLKLQGGLKAVLQRLAQQHLPPEVWDRPKHGFSVPLVDYYRQSWASVGDAWVAQCRSIAPFLDAAAIAQRWQRAKQGKGDLRLMFALLMLLGWLTTHPIES